MKKMCFAVRMEWVNTVLCCLCISFIVIYSQINLPNFSLKKNNNSMITGNKDQFDDAETNKDI